MWVENYSTSFEKISHCSFCSEAVPLFIAFEKAFFMSLQFYSPPDASTKALTLRISLKTFLDCFHGSWGLRSLGTFSFFYSPLSSLFSLRCFGDLVLRSLRNFCSPASCGVNWFSWSDYICSIKYELVSNYVKMAESIATFKASLRTS